MQRQASISRLLVCTGSGELFGPMGYDDGQPTHEQRCRWRECVYKEAPWHRPRTELPEPAGDFPTALELCYCCASTLIRSGSKFSSFFCDECGAAVQQLRESVGFTVIPLGRHSIMNGRGLGGAAECNPRLLAQFRSSIQQSFNGMDRLFLRRRGVIADHAEAIRPRARYVSASAYLAFTGRRALSKTAMFEQLRRYFGGDSGGR